MIIEKKGAILILSGPSGCGKSTLLKEVYKDIDDYYFSISTTTRAPRVGEINGGDGTSLKPINKALAEGKLVIFDIDVQGHEIVRTKLNSIVTSVFITTPSLEVLETRLNSRNTDSIEIIEKRIKNAKGEVEYFQDYDYLIINDNLEIAAKQLVSIANITRIKSTLFSKDKVVASWLK